ncbi:MAG: c-type cytochrome [Gemmatimonadota bacterium]
MNTISRTLLAVAVGGGLFLFPADTAAQQGDVAAGAKAYGNTCGRCHNPRSPVERSDRDWVVIINHMRARAGLTGQQVRDILAFLQASNHVEESLVAAAGGLARPASISAEAGVSAEISTDPGDVAKGQTLTAAKGCVGCHVIGGGGGQIGPKLNGVVATKGAEFVARKLANPAFNNPGTLMPNLGLSPDEIRALIAYLATLK